MKVLKQYWFNLLIALIIILGMGVTILVALSPKEDRLNRGFIPCTQELADNISACQGQIGCAARAVVQNSLCDAKIIGQGVKLWIRGEQAAPWSNYIFAPDTSDTQLELPENEELFYNENPNFRQDFEQVKKEHQKLEENNQHGSETK